VIADRNFDIIVYMVGNLALSVQALDRRIKLKLVGCHQKFAYYPTAENIAGSAVDHFLELRINRSNTSCPEQLKRKLCQVKTYELWEGYNDHWVFIQPLQNPIRWIVIDRKFQWGEIFGDFSSLDKKAFFPLQHIDIILFSNWLANYSDLILHAAGIAVDGKGYAFIGPSGIGKSTLVGKLAESKDVTVLGEDQVVLRYLNGRFWVFGTPWHENIDRCSPLGVPLKHLFFLDRSLNQTLKEISAFEGITHLMQTAFIPYYRPTQVKMIMDRLSLFGDLVPFHKLSYTLGTDILTEILSV
jgi:hypothetical protein